MEIGIKIFRNVPVSLACSWRTDSRDGEKRRKKKLRGLKERARLCRSLIFPSPSLPLLFFSSLSISRLTIQWRDRASGGIKGGGLKTQFGLKIRGHRTPGSATAIGTPAKAMVS